MKMQDNQERRRHNTISARQRYAWNLYNSFNDRLRSFARKWGYSDEALKSTGKYLIGDDDGSGEIDLVSTEKCKSFPLSQNF